MNRYKESELWEMRWMDHVFYARRSPERLDYQYAAADALAQMVISQALGK